MNTSIFGAGLDVHAYVQVVRNYRSLFRSMIEEARADDGHVSALAASVRDESEPVRATVMTEDWCGDSACVIPILSSLLSGAGVELRVIRGSEEQAIADYYHRNGVTHIPVFSIWDGDFKEIARWVESPAAVAVKKDAWQAERPEYGELEVRRKEDKEAAQKFGALYRQFVEEMITWYRAGMWDETTREVVEAVRGGMTGTTIRG